MIIQPSEARRLVRVLVVHSDHYIVTKRELTLRPDMQGIECHGLCPAFSYHVNRQAIMLDYDGCMLRKYAA